MPGMTSPIFEHHCNTAKMFYTIAAVDIRLGNPKLIVNKGFLSRNNRFRRGV